MDGLVHLHDEAASKAVSGLAHTSIQLHLIHSRYF